METSTPRTRAVFAAILIAYVLYALLFVWNTSFVLDDERTFCLLDDAMISMRYARNLAGGEGGVWNPGETPVEGFTNPLWVGYMALWHLLPIPASKMALPVQLTGILLTVLSLVLIWKTALDLQGGSPQSALAAAAVFAFYYGYNMWVLMGMETGAATLILIAVAREGIRWIRGTDHGRVRGRVVPLLALGVLLRMDMALPLFVIVTFSTAAVAVATGRLGIGVWVRLVAWIVLPLVGLMIARRVYFGDWFPNTYYLKIAGYPLGVRVARGLVSLHEFAVRHFYVPVLAVVASLAFVRRSADRTLLFLVFIVQCAYAVYVGGDAWKSDPGKVRFVAVAMPLFFVAVSNAALVAFPSIAARRGRLAGFIAGMMVVFYALDARETLLLRMPTGAEHNLKHASIASKMITILDPDDTVAVDAAGVIPYFTDLRSIDMLGKCDRWIARSVPNLPGDPTELHVGHHKKNYEYSIFVLQPDALCVWSMRNVLDYVGQGLDFNQFPAGPFKLGLPANPDEASARYAVIDAETGPPFLLVTLEALKNYTARVAAARERGESPE